jgi:hypothetical protein
MGGHMLLTLSRVSTEMNGNLPSELTDASLLREIYERPLLRRMGDIRELTLGGSGCEFETGGGASAFERVPPMC